jgi:hypothetical protein
MNGPRRRAHLALEPSDKDVRMLLTKYAEGIMTELVAVIQTSWPKIRLGLYRREGGRFQFVEEGIHTDEQGNDFWLHYVESDLYDNIEAAKSAMIEHYCLLTEDEFRVDPSSVTILDAPDFIGPHHPILIRV